MSLIEIQGRNVKTRNRQAQASKDQMKRERKREREREKHKYKKKNTKRKRNRKKKKEKRSWRVPSYRKRWSWRSCRYWPPVALPPSYWPRPSSQRLWSPDWHRCPTWMSTSLRSTGDWKTPCARPCPRRSWTLGRPTGRILPTNALCCSLPGNSANINKLYMKISQTNQSNKISLNILITACLMWSRENFWFVKAADPNNRIKFWQWSY